MYYHSSNPQPSHIMQMSTTVPPPLPHFSAISSYQTPQSYIMHQPRQNCDYSQSNAQFVPMKIADQPGQHYVPVPNASFYNQQQPQINQPSGHHPNKSQTMPVQSDDERYHKQLIVNYLAPEVTGTQLHSLFSRFGPLDGARVIYDKQTNMPRGYGFVYFHFPENAMEAVEAMNGFEYQGKRLKVGYSTNPLNIISRGSQNSYTPQSSIH